MKTVIVYFDADFDSDKHGYPADFSNEEILSLIRRRVSNIHTYGSIEDFCTAFNNEFISDLGYVRAVYKK